MKTLLHLRPARWLLPAALSLMLGCTTNLPVDAELNAAKTLLAEGRVREGHAALAALQAQRGTNDTDVRGWLIRARDRLAAELTTLSEAHLRQGQLNEAEAGFTALARLPGFEPSGRDGLSRVAAARTPTPAPILSDSASGLRLDRELRTPSSSARPVDDTPMARAMRKRISLQFRDAPLRSIFDVIGKTANLAVVFDRDVPPDQKLSISMKDVSIQAAVEQVSLSAGMSYRVLDAGTLLVYADTPRKQADYQGLMVRSFYLTNADARFVANSMKTLLKSRDIVVDAKNNMVVVRDTPEGLRLAEQLVQMQDVPEPEVILEVEVLEVKRSLLQRLGVDWPGQLNLSPLPMQLQLSGSAFDRAAPVTLRDVLSATSRTTEAGLSALSINARREDGDVKALATPRLRAKSREKARIMIGERVPNITSTSTSTGFVAESVNYVDVGLKLEMEPQVFAGGEVVIKLGLEVSSIVDQITSRSGSVAFRISTRNANTVLRLKDGENQLLAGLIQEVEQRTDGKLPGVGELPLIGRLFGSQRDDKSKTEIVLSITPRLIRPLIKPTAAQSTFELGTASGIRGRAEEGSVAETSPEPVPEPAPKSGESQPLETGSGKSTPR
ncbi:MAG: hypothetical protein RLZZ618_53 [Pseudomonadota bacterium]